MTMPPPPPPKNQSEVKRNLNDPLSVAHVFNQMAVANIPLAPDCDRVFLIFDYIGKYSPIKEDIKTSMRRFIAACHIAGINLITYDAAKMIYEKFPQLKSPMRFAPQ